MSIARYPRDDGWTRRVNHTLQTQLRCYCVEYGFYWNSDLSVAEFYYNCSINEATTHSPFEVMYGYQPSTPKGRHLPLTGVYANATVRINLFADI